ncbi:MULTISPECIES: hypothetical protein [unclassified Xanthobacter]|uniref:hypothetical protein n=1 Tax=unclassified Xanthobacter TaxID=2623496 RepID=UPI001F2C72BF|nr:MULTISPECIES: hypothetical protein [unclassified Xanthobacter]
MNDTTTAPAFTDIFGNDIRIGDEVAHVKRGPGGYMSIPVTKVEGFTAAMVVMESGLKARPHLVVVNTAARAAASEEAVG